MDLQEMALKEYEDLTNQIKEKERELKSLNDKRRPVKILLEDYGILERQKRVKK